MHRGSLVVILTMLILTSCAGVRQREDESLFTRARSDCRANIPVPPGKLVDRVTCINRAYDRYLRQHDESVDLSDLLASMRIVIAKKVDEGNLSREDANLQEAKFASQIASQRRDRALRNQEADSHRVAATAALIQSQRAFSPYLAPAPATLNPYATPVFTVPTQTQCMRFGDITNCTSY